MLTFPFSVAGSLVQTPGRDIHPLEVWIMMQTCFMSPPPTVMGIFGVRTDILTPANIDNLIAHYKALSSAVNI